MAKVRARTVARLRPKTVARLKAGLYLKPTKL